MKCADVGQLSTQAIINLKRGLVCSVRAAGPKHLHRSNNPAWLKPSLRRHQSNIDAPRSR